MRFVFLLLIISLISGCQTIFYRGPISDHFDGKKFYYPGEKNLPENRLYDLVNLCIAIFQNPWPLTSATIHYSTLYGHPKEPKITYINHSSVLIQTHHVTFLFDPIYSNRASPFQWIGPKRHCAPGVKFTDLPKIDVVLISHNHYDHLDISTLKRLDKTFHPLFIVPLGNKLLLKRHNINNVIEVDWWQKIRIKKAIVTFLPAHHDTQRGLFDFNRTLWGSFGIKVDNKRIYFAGDTGYANHFLAIRKYWGRPDFSFLPIGAYEPRSLSKLYHLNPQDAVKSHLDLGSRMSMGIHWGTFQLGSESNDQPLKDLITARQRLHVSPHYFFAILTGKPFNIEHPMGFFMENTEFRDGA